MPEACQTITLGNKPYRCGFELTLDLIGGKWKLLIIYFLAERPVLRFGEPAPLPARRQRTHAGQAAS